MGNRWGELYNPSNPASYSFLVRRRKAVELLGDLKGQRLLDAGCGSGALIELLKEREVEYHGADSVPEMIRHAQKCIRDLGLTSRFTAEVADAESLPYPDEAFDAVIGLGLLEYFEDPRQVLREALRVARPGARLVFNVPRKFSCDDLLVRTTGPLRALVRFTIRKPAGIRRNTYTQGQFRRLLLDAGCRVTAQCSYNKLIIPYPFSRVWPKFTSRIAAWAEDKPGLDFFATGSIMACVK